LDVLKASVFILLLGAAFWGCESSGNPDNAPHPANASIRYSAGLPALSPEEADRYKALVSEHFQSTLLRSGFNGSILVAKNGTVVYEQYVGYKDRKTKDTMTAETPIQIASISKTFTSAAILRLVQEKKLNLHDSLAQFFPGIPYPDVTIQNLLTHRSGLPEYIYYFESYGWNRNVFASNADVVNTLSSWRPGRAARPGQRFDYCNTNFVLLASIVEKVSGLSYPEYMDRNFFTPLQMNRTFVYTTADSAGATRSYEPGGGEWALDFSDGTYGDKNIYSTPRDLLRWDQALYSGQLIDQQLLDSAYTPYSNERKSQHNYGLGWRLLLFENGKKIIYHTGRWHGFNTIFSRLPDEKATIIILSNKYNRGVYTSARGLYNVFGHYDEGKDGEHED
jgi:CubicO group peptidase (beta-lactamase class C family)